MLLQHLSDYADRLPSPPPTGYEPTAIRYYIQLDASGRLVNPRPQDTAEPKDPTRRRGIRRPAPQLKRTSGVKPLLLADKADYILGYVGEQTTDPQRVFRCHQASLALIDRCAESTREPAVRAVQTFLRASPLDQLTLPDEFDPSDFMSFEVDGVCPIDLESVKSFWAAELDPTTGDAPVMQCVVCGKERPVLRRLQGSIKGIPGGQTAGMSIISANAEAFESYGLEASLIAPTCAACGERFTRAANALLRDPSRHLTLGSAAFIFWNRSNVEFSIVSVLDEPSEVREMIDTIRSGRPMPDLDEIAFYAAALSASGARVVIRDWVDTTIGQVRHSLARWFAGQEIVGPFGEDAQPLGLYALAASTVRDPRKELAPPTLRSLLRAAIAATPLPDGLLAQAIRRNCAEARVTRQRATLIKLALSSQQQEKEDWMPTVRLDTGNTNAAYLSGRLLAVLEEAQQAALGRVNATIVDRFYSSASSAPALVFGRLLRGVQPHLSKLDADPRRRGAYVALQERLGEILGGFDPQVGFPRTLTLRDQALFSLGYYHQRAHDRARMRAAGERRRTEDAPTSADETLGEVLAAAVDGDPAGQPDQSKNLG